MPGTVQRGRYVVEVDVLGRARLSWSDASLVRSIGAPPGTNPCSPINLRAAGQVDIKSLRVPPTGFEPDGCTGPFQWIVVETMLGLT
jgi:hypothetical protein